MGTANIQPRARPVEWSRLSDDVLVKFGAKDSVRAATIAINAELLAFGWRKPDALVIADESVMSPENESGIVMVDELNSWHANVAFNEDGKDHSAADRLTCALAILGAHSTGTEDGGEEQLRKAQLVVTELLLQHPVLLHPRLVIPFRVRQVKHMSVFSAIMMTGYAQLPSARHGVDSARVKAFAKCALVMAPMERKVPDMAYAPNSMLGLNRKRLDYSGHAGQAALLQGSPFSPEFLASQMEINRLRGTDFWSIFTTLKAFLAALPIAAGLYECTSVSRGVQKTRVCEALFDEAVSSGIIGNDLIRKHLPQYLQRSTILSDGSAPSVADQKLPQWAVESNTTQVLGMLEKIGLAGNQQEAAEWLYLQLVGGGDDGSRPLPWALIPSAMGFLESLSGAGMKLPEAASINAAGTGLLATNAETWRTAHEVIGRKRAMEAVLVAAAASTVTQGDSESEQRRRGPRV